MKVLRKMKESSEGVKDQEGRKEKKKTTTSCISPMMLAQDLRNIYKRLGRFVETGCGG